MLLQTARVVARARHGRLRLTLASKASILWALATVAPFSSRPCSSRLRRDGSTSKAMRSPSGRVSSWVSRTPSCRRSLHGRSGLFARCWTEHAVVDRTGGERIFDHPRKGRLRYQQIAFALANRPDFKLVMPESAATRVQKRVVPSTR
jgi:hypothetical protein